MEHQRVSITIDESAGALAGDRDLLDQELLTSLASEDLPDVTLEEGRAVLAGIPGTMTAAFAAESQGRF